MTRPTEHSYFVAMRDHGRLGLEAIVQPEITRRGVIERIASGEWSDVVFVHHIRDCTVEDVTAEIMEAAGVMEDA